MRAAAVAIQQEIRARNGELPLDAGWNFASASIWRCDCGGERIYGDGVNIAARLEGLAEPGGICISGTAYDQVEGKLAFTYAFEGERTVRNIAKPVRVYRCTWTPKARPHECVPAGGKVSNCGGGRRRSRSALLILRWGDRLATSLGRSPLLCDGVIRAPEATALAAAEPKPSIGRTGLCNLSQDPEQE